MCGMWIEEIIYSKFGRAAMAEGCGLTLKICSCFIFYVIIFLNACDCRSADSKSPEQDVFSQRFKLEGKVAVSGASDEWISNVRILVDGGQYLGLLK